jgi:chaperonin GroEL
LREGVVPGGGVAFLDCRDVLRKRLPESNEPEELAAYQILIKALEVPTRIIISNSGMDDNEVMAEIRQAGPGFGYDVQAGKVVKMAESGIFDVYTAVKSAVRSAVSGAGLALTTDVIVHRRKVIESMEP